MSFLCLKNNPWYHTDLSQPRVVILSGVEGFVSVVIQGDVTRPLFAFIEDLNIRLLPVDPPVNGSVCAGVHIQQIALVTESNLPVTQFIFQNEEIRPAAVNYTRQRKGPAPGILFPEPVLDFLKRFYFLAVFTAFISRPSQRDQCRNR